MGSIWSISKIKVKFNFDALSVAPFAIKHKIPIILVDDISVDKLVKEADYRIKNIYVIGGEKAIDNSIINKLKKVLPERKIKRKGPEM